MIERNGAESFVRRAKIATVRMLAAVVAHEFNNLLTDIGGYAQLAETGRASLHDLVEVCLRECERGSQIVRDLLSFSGRIEQEERDVDVNVFFGERPEIVGDESRVLCKKRAVVDVRPQRGGGPREAGGASRLRPHPGQEERRS